MAQFQVQSVEHRTDGIDIGFAQADAGAVAEQVDVFFDEMGYRLETGQPGNATYGIGSDLWRMLFGAFARRYKFSAVVSVEGPTVWLRVDKAISGAMGGVMGHSAMTKETHRVCQALEDCFAGQPSA